MSKPDECRWAIERDLRHRAALAERSTAEVRPLPGADEAARAAADELAEFRALESQEEASVRDKLRRPDERRPAF